MKVLLIQPNYRKIYSYAGSKSLTPIFPPMGLAYIAAVLKENNIDVKIIESNVLNYSYAKIKNIINNEKPDIVGITSTTSLIEEANKIAGFCQKGTLVVVGGVHASAMPEETLKEFKNFDIAVRGEGEFVMLDIAKGVPLERIKGITFRRNGKIIKNENRELIQNLDELPFPARDLLPWTKYFSAGARRQPSDYILSSRGCPYQCNFCADHLVHGMKFRYRSPKNIVKEIEMLMGAYGIKEFDFIDDNFTLLDKRAEEICDLLIKKGLNKKLIWRCSNGVRIDRLSLSLLKKMKKAGCYMLSLGIESGNEQILKNIKKGITLDKVRETVDNCGKLEIETRGLFMMGNLGENEKTMQDTINFAKSLDLDAAVFHITIPFPMTEYWRIIKREGEIFPKRYRDYIAYGKVVFEHGQLTPELLLRMQKRAYREYYFRPKMFLNKLKMLKSKNGIKTLFNGALGVLKFVFSK